MNTKPWYRSKTVWWNVITIIVTVAAIFGYQPNEEIATAVTTTVVALSPLVNLILRFVTKEAIE